MSPTSYVPSVQSGYRAATVIVSSAVRLMVITDMEASLTDASI